MMLTKIAVSLPAELLTEVDELATARHTSRSAVVREGLETLLRQEREQATLARAYQLYAEIATEDTTLAEDFMNIAAETLPPCREVS